MDNSLDLQRPSFFTKEFAKYYIIFSLLFVLLYHVTKSVILGFRFPDNKLNMLIYDNTAVRFKLRARR